MESAATIATREVVMQYFTALQQRNLEATTALFADEVDWYIPGNEVLAPWLGRRSTKAAIADFFKLLWPNTEAITATVDNLLVVENVAIISGSFATRMLQTGRVFESLFFIELTVANGLIIKYRLLEEGYGLVKALEG